MTYDNPNEIIEKLFDSHLSKYQISLQIQMRGNDFVFDCVNLLYYKYWFPRLGKKEKNNKSKKDDYTCFQ